VAEINVEAFVAGVGALVSGDVEAALVYMDPDVVFEPLRSATEGNYVDHDGIRRLLYRFKDYGEAEAALAAAGLRE
jgi:hypothetical protein